MNFPYSASVVARQPDGDFLLAHRPELLVTISGPKGSATLVGLVDTGSDYSIFPQSFAELLGIELQPSMSPGARVFGGQAVNLLSGVAALMVESDGEAVTWQTELEFFTFGSDAAASAILGHAGFLEFFTAIFDGDALLLTLLPNQHLPIS